MNKEFNDKIEEIKSKDKYNNNIRKILLKIYEEKYHSKQICNLLNITLYRKVFFTTLGIDFEECGTFQQEHYTINKKKIDIYLETDNIAIAIENKIFADDSNNQLEDYWKYICQKNKKSYLIYLKVINPTPKNYSISKELWYSLIETKKCFQFSYSDIYYWLGKCQKLNNTSDEALDDYFEQIKYMGESLRHIKALKKIILKEFPYQTINTIDDWNKINKICQHTNPIIKHRLHWVCRKIWLDIAYCSIRKNIVSDDIRISSNIVSYTKNTYSLDNNKVISLRLLHVDLFDKDTTSFYRSPFAPYIGVYDIPKEHYEQIKNIASRVFKDYNYSITCKDNYLHADIIPFTNYNLLLDDLDQSLIQYFKNI